VSAACLHQQLSHGLLSLHFSCLLQFLLRLLLHLLVTLQTPSLVLSRQCTLLFMCVLCSPYWHALFNAAWRRLCSLSYNVKVLHATQHSRIFATVAWHCSFNTVKGIPSVRNIISRNLQGFAWRRCEQLATHTEQLWTKHSGTQIHTRVDSRLIGSRYDYHCWCKKTTFNTLITPTLCSVASNIHLHWRQFLLCNAATRTCNVLLIN